MRVLAILSRLFRSLLSSKSSYLRQRILEGWVTRKPEKIKWRSLEHSGSLEVTEADLRALKQMRQSDGWRLLNGALEDLADQCSEQLMAAQKAEDIVLARKFFEGHTQTKNLLNALIEQGEIGDSEWVQQQLEKAHRMASLTLGTDPTPRALEMPATPGQRERLSRVKRAYHQGQGNDRP